MSIVEVEFPGNLSQVNSAASLRALPSAFILDNAMYLVSDLGLYTYDAGSLATDNGTTILKPDDLTPLQAGRWVLSGSTVFDTGLRAALLASSGSNNVGFIGSGAGATARTSQDKMRDTVSAKDFGAKGDGTTDDAPFMQSAITASLTDRNRAVHLPEGAYKINSGLLVKQGVMIAADGSQGSTEDYGTNIKVATNSDAVTFDGSGAAFTGTGGGLTNVLITKQSGFTGGAAIKIVATDDSHRPGEMILSNVLAYGAGTGTFLNGLVVDGSACNTPGARGVRSVHLYKCRFAGTTDAYRTVVLKQVTHFFAFGLAIDTATGSNPGLYLEGINDGVFLPGLDCAGRVTIVADDPNNSTDNLHIQGKVGSFVNNDTGATGTALISFGRGSISVITNKSKRLKIVSDYAPDFGFELTTTSSGVMGNGTLYNIIFDGKIRDKGNNFAASGPWGGYTCLCAGSHQFNLHATMGSLDASNTTVYLKLSRKTSGGALVQDYTLAVNPGAIRTAGNQASLMLSESIDLDYGDTVTPSIQVFGGAGTTVTMIGTADDGYTAFSGKYIP